MLYINKFSSDSVVDFAAEELRKYLRMMMPEIGEVRIAYAPDAEGGFRLGLMQDLGLDTSDVEDVGEDDIIYIDCSAEGGVIAGDNPCAALIAVYEYLRHNGCRWLMPGVDGEYIPMKDVEPVRLRHKPSCRYRAHCWEGAVFQEAILDMIDFAPKVGMSSFMLEHADVNWYYEHYYLHLENRANREPEHISKKTATQWKRAAESEIAKRGLRFHNIGHGWTSDPFSGDWDNNKKYLAELGGKRDFFGGAPVYTNFCMSNREARKIVVDYFVDYCRRHGNTDFMHVWLADMSKNHCECAECRKKTPSDWYVVLLNEMDAALTEAGLDTKIVFIVYVDTTWAPLTERFNNPGRFSMMLAPIGRKYTETLPEKPTEGLSIKPFMLNAMELPGTLEENILYYKEWLKVFPKEGFVFEYHFWRHLFTDPSGIYMARRVHEDVKAYKRVGINGVIEDGTQRPFFPNGFAFYTYARTLYDTSLTFEEIAEDYFSCAYGEDWREFYGYLCELGDAFDMRYMQGEMSTAPDFSAYYNPEVAKKLERVPGITERGRALMRTHYDNEDRVRTVSSRLIGYHADYCDLIAAAFKAKALGEEDEAVRLIDLAANEFGKREAYIEKYFDHFLAFHFFHSYLKPGNLMNKPIIDAEGERR